MLLSPHHLQQQDAYHEALLDARLEAVAPYGWGVQHLELDLRALASGQLLVRSFAGILPRGTVVRFSLRDDEAPLSRTLEGHFAPHAESLDVYLALPLAHGRPASSEPDPAAPPRARYVSATRSVDDADGSAPAESIEFARPNVVVLLGDEAREGYEALKIAELVRDAAGQVQPSFAYVPPLLRFEASPFVRDGVRRILTAAVAKHAAVRALVRQRDASAVEFGADEVTRFLALQALGGAIPSLRHLDEHGALGPQEAYRVLLTLAGQLAAFAVDGDPTRLPSYRHDDLRTTFEPLFAAIARLLSVAVPSRVRTLALEPRADGAHLARLDERALLETGTRLLLSVQTALDEQRAYEAIPKVAKVASWGDIPRLVNAAIPGVTLAAMPRPPREISARPGRLHFTLDTEHPLWRNVAHEQTLAVHLPPPFEARSTRVELLAIPQA